VVVLQIALFPYNHDKRLASFSRNTTNSLRRKRPYAYPWLFVSITNTFVSCFAIIEDQRRLWHVNRIICFTSNLVPLAYIAELNEEKNGLMLFWPPGVGLHVCANFGEDRAIFMYLSIWRLTFAESDPSVVALLGSGYTTHEKFGEDRIIPTNSPQILVWYIISIIFLFYRKWTVM
jgi:hypothetical protein